MNKILPIALVMSFAVPLHAQYHLSACAGGSVVSAHLQNNSDKNPPPYTTGSTKRHWNFTPNYYLGIGLYSEKAVGFQGLAVGLSADRYLQHYDANINNTTGNASSELRYLSIPLSLRFGLGKFLKNYTCFTEMGGYFAILQDYKEHVYTVNTFGVYDEANVHNNDISSHVSLYANPEISSRLNYWIYKKYDWGLLGAMGVKRDLNEAFSLSLKAQLAFSLVKDIEEKGATTTNKPMELVDFWDNYAPKGYLPNNSISNVARGNTRLIVPGLQLAFTYTFKPSKHDKAK